MPCDLSEHDEENNVLLYFFSWKVERLMPCPNCRPDAFTQKQNELIAMLQEQHEQSTGRTL